VETFAFGDPAANVYGSARPGLVVLFADGLPVAVAQDDVEVDDGSVRFDDGEHAFTLTFEAAGPPADLDGADAQPCHVYGTVRLGDETREVRGLGERDRAPEPDWDGIDAARSVAAWLDDGSAVVLNAFRPSGASYEDEDTAAAVLGAGGSLRVDEPRLSTTYDEDGRQQRAGLELWVGEEDAYPRRANGEVLCGATLDLGPLRLDCAFLRWRMDGRSGIGRYDLLRRA
jgi:hypothetical protein